ncbi:glycoside hydrolase family 20 zincin-like fold domain-containing protein [Actinoplanes sp. CA-252034]|uniref:glycoside hydrolase family 20 zincin-like fold domain-containing protein n=1 Tax=Actinoplanes sp. CA-252034 TaxID=3239906 RepID=UPI003D967ACE
MLTPRPHTLVPGHGELVLDHRTTVGAPAALSGVLTWLQSALRPPTGLPLPHASATDATITLALDEDLDAEAFRLRVTPRQAIITGGGPAGVFWGCQALLQLLPPAVHRKAPGPVTDGRSLPCRCTTPRVSPGAGSCSTSPATSCPNTTCCGSST